MIRKIITAAALALATALPAQADQFAVRLDAAYPGASSGLMATLHVSEIESFTENGATYVILDAPNAAYVEAFFNAIGRDVVELNELDANWTAPAFASLPMPKRMEFLRPVTCDFCTG